MDSSSLFILVHAYASEYKSEPILIFVSNLFYFILFVSLSRKQGENHPG